MTNGCFEVSLTETKAGHEKEPIIGGLSRVTFDVLPDVALLDIFDFYVDTPSIDSWHTLVHVCQKWRNLVFGSPRRLNLRLHCTDKTPVMEMLDVWPLLPIVLKTCDDQEWRMDNVFAALEHNDRICQLILLDLFPDSQFEEVLEDLQQPFPALTHLHLAFGEEKGELEEEEDEEESWPVVPTSFLGGSAPRLQTLTLRQIPFPGLPKLLLSATHLVNLDLWSIPESGYISPEAMATTLSVLTRLERLVIEFKFFRISPDRNSRPLPPQTRVLLPVLVEWTFKGFNEYLEVLVARIDAPQLGTLKIIFFHQSIFDTPELAQFIGRTPNFEAHYGAHVTFFVMAVSVTFPQSFDGELELGVSYEQADYLELSSMAQVCSSSLPQALFPAVEHLYVTEHGNIYWQDYIENSDWLEFFHLFTAVKGLYICQEFTEPVAFALQELVGERVMEVLPALQSLFFGEPPLRKPVQKAIVQFVSPRLLAGHPIALSFGI